MKRQKIDLETQLETLAKTKPQMSKITDDGLDVDYTILLPQGVADEIMQQLEETVEYYEGDLTKVKVFGKWHSIPRQQVAYGAPGIKYTFSGITIPAKPWTSCLQAVRKLVENVTGYDYNFVLINRYRNGADHLGEHRDGEKELDKNTPIASLSFGQHREFVLKHRDARKKGKEKRNIPIKKINLEHGSLLLMNPPTNEVWYHSIPQRKSAAGARINLTFRKINVSNEGY